MTLNLTPVTVRRPPAITQTRWRYPVFGMFGLSALVMAFLTYASVVALLDFIR
jgi:hypothetical protein